MVGAKNNRIKKSKTRDLLPCEDCFNDPETVFFSASRVSDFLLFYGEKDTFYSKSKIITCVKTII